MAPTENQNPAKPQHSLLAAEIKKAEEANMAWFKEAYPPRPKPFNPEGFVKFNCDPATLIAATEKFNEAQSDYKASVCYVVCMSTSAPDIGLLDGGLGVSFEYRPGLRRTRFEDTNLCMARMAEIIAELEAINPQPSTQSKPENKSPMTQAPEAPRSPSNQVKFPAFGHEELVDAAAQFNRTNKSFYVSLGTLPNEWRTPVAYFWNRGDDSPITDPDVLKGFAHDLLAVLGQSRTQGSEVAHIDYDTNRRFGGHSYTYDEWHGAVKAFNELGNGHKAEFTAHPMGPLVVRISGPDPKSVEEALERALDRAAGLIKTSPTQPQALEGPPVGLAAILQELREIKSSILEIANTVKTKP